MPTSSFLVSTWDSGVFSVAGTTVLQERPGQAVRSVVADGRGGVLAIVDGHALCRRSAAGAWTTLIKNEHALSCCVPLGDAIFVGTDDARILRVAPDGAQQWMTAFDAVAGRETWYAGTALVNGVVMGPPLGIRSMTATCGGVLLANVHVGGIPRSADGGLTWQPTIPVESDVHQVRAHPTRPGLVIAAAAAGLCISRDAGATWAIEARGLHAPHCSAVTFGSHDVFVSASVDPFSTEGAVYRRPIDSDGPLRPVGGGLPLWTSGAADTDCMATRFIDHGATIAMIDKAGCLYVSQDDGVTWSSRPDRLPGPSGLHILASAG